MKSRVWCAVSSGLLVAAIGCSSNGGGTASSHTSANAAALRSRAPLSSGQPIPPIPNGTYVHVVTRGQWLKCSAEDVDENTGTESLRVQNGRWQSLLTANHEIANPVFTGTYSGTGKIATFTPDPNHGDVGPMTVRWQVVGGSLHVTAIKFLDAEGKSLPPCLSLLGSSPQPWRKVS